MIPDFPEAKKQIQKAVDLIMREKVKQNAPLLALGNKKMLHEGDSLGVIYEDGRHTVNPIQVVESSFTIAKSDMPNLKTEDFMAKVNASAEDMAGQMERNAFKAINDSIKESGNTIPGNPILSPEGILAGLEKMSIDFEDDDRSKPSRPTIFAHPEAVEKLKEIEAKSTPEEKEAYQKKQEEIFDRKFAEHLKDLESRKIID